MDLITCPKCEKQIREVAVFCPYCGFRLSNKKEAKQKEEQHEFHNTIKNSSHWEMETINSWIRKPHPIAGIITFLIIVIPLLLWDSFKSSDFSKSSKENTKDIINSSTNNPAKPYSSSSNEYVVKDDIWAATSEASFDLMMDCLISGDKQALQVMLNNGQLIYLHRNDVVFLVEAKFKCYIVKQEGSTELLYVDSGLLRKQ